jgi:hypothetical protein
MLQRTTASASMRLTAVALHDDKIKPLNTAHSRMWSVMVLPCYSRRISSVHQSSVAPSSFRKPAEPHDVSYGTRTNQTSFIHKTFFIATSHQKDSLGLLAKANSEHRTSVPSLSTSSTKDFLISHTHVPVCAYYLLS